MKYSKLKDEYLKEESFWHVTSKGNLKSIEGKEIVEDKENKKVEKTIVEEEKERDNIINEEKEG